jgi:hypothetical protein
MRDLRIKEPMTAAEKKELGENHPMRKEYVYGAVVSGQTNGPNPILLKSLDFWMPLSRAKRIHKWLGEAIRECEQRRRKKWRS